VSKQLLLTFFSIAFVSAAHAETETLLRCNLEIGSNQEVKVLRVDGKLVMKELTSHGSFVSRDLSEKEWNSGVLNLHKGEFVQEATLTKDEDGGWFINESGYGTTQMGLADCY
jgi:hypothetical protein